MLKQRADTLIEFIKREITWGGISKPATLTESPLSALNDEWINKFINDPTHQKRLIKDCISAYRDSKVNYDDPSMVQQLRACIQSNINYITTELVRYCRSILDYYQQLREAMNQRREHSMRDSSSYIINHLYSKTFFVKSIKNKLVKL